MGWVGKRLRRVVPIVALFVPVVPIGIVAGLYPGYKAYEYVWKDARFCMSCHVHDYASFSWKGSAHGKLTTCHDCHHQPLHAYMMEPVVLVLHNPKFPEDLKHVPHVPAHLCESCHTKNGDLSTITGPFEKADVQKIPKIDDLYLHRVHLEAKTDRPVFHDTEIQKTVEDVRASMLGPQKLLPKGSERAITCTDCHGGPANRAHDFRANDLSCVRCHQAEHKTKVASNFGCASCHFQGFVTPMNQAHGAPSKPWLPKR